MWCNEDTAWAGTEKSGAHVTDTTIARSGTEIAYERNTSAGATPPRKLPRPWHGGVTNDTKANSRSGQKPSLPSKPIEVRQNFVSGPR
jgi:hypothetical protein